MNATETINKEPAPILTKADRCDRCNSEAFYKVIFPSLNDLLFCRHHFTKYQGNLEAIAIDIVDESTRIK